MYRVALRPLSAAAVLAACAGEPPMSGSVEAATPALIWQDMASLRVLCLVTAESGVDPRLQGRICDRVRDFAAAGAPVPVATIEAGDPAVLAPDAVTLLVHASVQRSSQGRLLAFTVRPFRNSADRSDLLFAAAPRAVAMPTGDDGAALDEALSAALAETLPWLAAPARVRRIDP